MPKFLELALIIHCLHHQCAKSIQYISILLFHIFRKSTQFSFILLNYIKSYQIKLLLDHKIYFQELWLKTIYFILCLSQNKFICLRFSPTFFKLCTKNLNFCCLLVSLLLFLIIFAYYFSTLWTRYVWLVFLIFLRISQNS